MPSPWKTYIVPMRVTYTEEFEVRARSATEAMDKVETGDHHPVNCINENREVDYHRIREVKP